MNTALIVDLVAFAVLLSLSALVRSRFNERSYSATASGGIVMAIGIFVSFSLPQLPVHWPLLARVMTLELLVIWLFIAGSYCASAVNGHFHIHVTKPLQRFAVGTWVAGTAVLAVLSAHTLPEAPFLEKTLTLIAVAVYLPYVALFVRGYYRLLRRPTKQKANGVILLATVSTQSIVIALATAFGPAFPDAIGISMLAIDSIFLCTGLVLIALHYHATDIRMLADKWQNANCIIHGAVSITGLALVLTTDADLTLLLSVWGIVVVLFVIVELLELVRLVERVRQYGFRRGVFVYDVSQWTRNFTFGMFYAFSITLYHHLIVTTPAADSPWHLVLRDVVGWGQYVVLAVLLVEIALFLCARLHVFWHASGNWRSVAPR